MEKEKKGVRLDHISKIYKDPKTGKDFYAVKDTCLEIRPGSFVTLLGPSGCGKTTTLRMIAGFESPDEGEIYLGNEAINALPPNKRDTAMVFQSYALLPHYNVFDNVAYGLKLRKVPKDEIKERVTRILELVELSGMEARMTNQLSGGQQQRVALARALVLEPGVLLFDEPLSNLDAKLRVSMRTEIRRIQQATGITAIYVTHDQSEAMALSDSIIIMNKGVVAQIGSPQEIYYHPNSEFVADFIGEANFLRGKCVTLEGGSGRATVESPAVLTVADGIMTATIVWSSPNYDYMLVDGEKYLPVNTDGNSTFEIPVAALDTALAVTADTVAMSTPHEIDYTLTFDSATLATAE